MLRDQQVGVESDWTWGANAASTSNASHREIDRALRRIAKTRCGLDADEARWLRRADEQKVWPKLGYVHAPEYLEDVFGYAPRTAQERMRVAHDLGSLPQLETALEDGTVSWSVARELTRVATAETEARWLAAASGKNLRQVERLVAGHDKGSDPDDAPDPELAMQTVTLRLRPSTIALLRHARALLDDERGEHLDDDAACEAMCRRVLDGGCSDATSTGPARMIHLTICRTCKQTTQDGSGAKFDLGASERELAECDAIVCDDDNGARATHTIPPVTRRKVMTRDEGRCRVPGCRAARNLDVHHIVHRAHGGGHETSNLAVLCSGHHRLLHDGVITASGDANDELTFTRDGKVLVDSPAMMRLPSPRPLPTLASSAATSARSAATPSPSTSTSTSTRSAAASAGSATRSTASTRFADVERRTLAKAALQQAGFKAAIAKQAISIAEAQIPSDAGLEALLREALRHCS